MQSAMEKSCFVVGLCCVSIAFCLTASLSATLQSRNVDLAQCMKHVDRVFNEAKAMRNDAVNGFSSLFIEAQEMATSIVCEIRAPRQCGLHVNRDSCGTSDPQTYYRLSAYIPFLDFLIHELQDRFLKHRSVLCSSAPCCRTALQRKEQKQDRSAARSKTSTRRISRLPRWTR